jgi:hypothetical protein
MNLKIIFLIMTIILLNLKIALGSENDFDIANALGSRRGGGRFRRGDGAGILFVEDVGVGDGEFDVLIYFGFCIIKTHINIYWCISIFPCSIWSDLPNECF